MPSVVAQECRGFQRDDWVRRERPEKEKNRVLGKFQKHFRPKGPVIFHVFCLMFFWGDVSHGSDKDFRLWLAFEDLGPSAASAAYQLCVGKIYLAETLIGVSTPCNSV